MSDPNGNVADNWGTKDNPTAHDSNGFTSTYNGEGQPDDVSYASWNDHNDEDYDRYMDDPTWDPTREGTVGVLTKEVAWSAGKYGKTGSETYGQLKKMPAADYFHPGASGVAASGDAIFGLVPGGGLATVGGRAVLQALERRALSGILTPGGKPIGQTLSRHSSWRTVTKGELDQIERALLRN